MSKREWEIAVEAKRQIEEELKAAKITIKNLQMVAEVDAEENKKTVNTNLELLGKINKLEKQLKDAEDHCIKYETQISELEEDVAIFKKASKELADKNKENSITIKELKQAIKSISKHLD